MPSRDEVRAGEQAQPGEVDAARLSAWIERAVHEMRGPVHAMGLLLHFIERQGSAGAPPDPAALGRGKRVLRRLGRTLDEMADLARLREGPLPLVLEDLDVVELARWAAQEVDPSRAGDVRLELPPEAVPVRADRKRLGHLLVHVLESAAQHTPAGAPVVLRVQGPAAPGDAVEVVVSDGGYGSGGQQAGGPLQPRQGGGPGIGLLLGEPLLRQHGGALEMTASGPQGEGLKVRLRLPAGPADPRSGG